MNLNHKSPAQQWIDAGFATRSEKGKNADFDRLTFSEAEANAFLYLNGKGAEHIERTAKDQHSR